MGTLPNNGDRLRLQRWFAYLCMGLGVLLILASFNGSWGKAYGQTVPTPTPSLNYADPQITKIGQPYCCEPGDPVVYTIVATNVGTAPATGVVISDTIPPELHLVSVTSSKGIVTINGNFFRVDIGAIYPGEIITIVVHAIVPEGVPDNTVITNWVFLHSNQGNRQASADVLLREEGGCATPPVLPPTGYTAPEPGGGTSLWLLLAGLLLLLLGIALAVRARVHPTSEQSH
jgi:uncharacterized repeat protein (TIGR01451 family)